jgi:hypothetical protein
MVQYDMRLAKERCEVWSNLSDKNRPDGAEGADFGAQGSPPRISSMPVRHMVLAILSSPR